MTQSDTLRESIESGQFGKLAGAYASDALLDATVGTWRLQRQGPEAIIRQFEKWYPTPPRLLSWREWPTEWGTVIQAEERQGEGEAELYFRYVNLLFITAGRVTEHICHCSGPWDRAAVRRHAEKAPMVHQ